jgi:formiminotetrahydrofolate cyclodeaminase
MERADSGMREFLEELAAAAATPGGGAAAAVAGSLAAALVGMIGRLTLKREQGNPELEGITQQADRLREELLELAERDAEAFQGVLAAYRLPKSDEDERAERRQAIQEALKAATEIPFRTASACASVLELAQRAVNYGLRSAVSDAATAACLAEAALHSAVLNVETNLKSIEDEKYRHLYHIKCTDLAKQARVRVEAILAVVEEWIRPE